nr:MAG TPA: hypothetical protein [Caudoviricetes sp.]
MLPIMYVYGAGSRRQLFLFFLRFSLKSRSEREYLFLLHSCGSHRADGWPAARP